MCQILLDSKCFTCINLLDYHISDPRYDDIGNFSFYKKINGNNYHGYICTEWQFYNKYIKRKLGLNDYYSPGRTYLEYTYYLHK